MRKPAFLHLQNQRDRIFAVIVQLIGASVFATLIEDSVYILNKKKNNTLLIFCGCAAAPMVIAAS